MHLPAPCGGKSVINKLLLAGLVLVWSGAAFAQSCAHDFEFVSASGDVKSEDYIAALKKGLGATTKGYHATFMSIAADPYIQHSPDLPDGWQPV